MCVLVVQLPKSSSSVRLLGGGWGWGWGQKSASSTSACLTGGDADLVKDLPPQASGSGPKEGGKMKGLPMPSKGAAEAYGLSARTAKLGATITSLSSVCTQQKALLGSEHSAWQQLCFPVIRRKRKI